MARSRGRAPILGRGDLDRRAVSFLFGCGSCWDRRTRLPTSPCRRLGCHGGDWRSCLPPIASGWLFHLRGALRLLCNRPCRRHVLSWSSRRSPGWGACREVGWCTRGWVCRGARSPCRRISCWRGRWFLRGYKRLFLYKGMRTTPEARIVRVSAKLRDASGGDRTVKLLRAIQMRACGSLPWNTRRCSNRCYHTSTDTCLDGRCICG